MKTEIAGTMEAGVPKQTRMGPVARTIPQWTGSLLLVALLLPAPLATFGGQNAADIGVDKSSSPDPVGAGSNLTYTITVTNSGPLAATVATLTDVTPTNTTFQSIDEPLGWVCSTPSVGESGTIICTNLSFDAGTASTFTLVVEVNPQTGEGTVITNVAEVSSTIPDLILADNSVTNLTTVSPGAANVDLAVSKTDSPDPAGIGSNLTYTVTVTNLGPETATNVTLEDGLPANVNFVSASSGCGNLLGVVTCDLGSLDSGGSTNVTIVVTTTTGGLITNTAVVFSDAADSVSTNDTATTVTAVGTDLAITKTDSPDPVTVNANLTYTITITNRGGNAATSVVLTDTLPGQASFVSASSGCNEVGGVVTCNLGTLNSSDSTNVTIVITPTASGSITNTAEVSSAAQDPIATNNIASAVTAVGEAADLAVTKTDSPDPVFVDSNLTYVVTITNRGPDTATNVVLTDTLPATVNFVSASSGCGNLLGIVTCNLGALASGGSTNVTIVVTALDAGSITNSAEVSSGIPDSVSTNDIATAVTTVSPAGQDADLAVTKTDSPDPVFVGSNLTYTVTVTNRGPDSATSVVLTDTLSDDVAFVSASSGCGEVTGVVTCNLGTLASGTRTNITIVVTPTSSGLITNVAEVSSAVPDSVSTNDVATAVTSVSPAPQNADLAVTKTDSPDPVGVGNNLTYTITVTNRGPNTATSVVLSDTLSDDVAFVSASSGCGEVAGVVTCNLGTLTSGARTNVTIVVTPTNSGSITNIVTVDSNVNDPSSGNNVAQQVTSVLGPVSGIDLTGSWSNVVATCKNEKGKVKGKIIIENLGTEDAPTSFVDFYLSDNALFDGSDLFLKQVATGKVKPEKVKKKNLSASLQGECFTGRFIIAVIDADDTVEESDEDNNVIVFGPLP